MKDKQLDLVKRAITLIENAPASMEAVEWLAEAETLLINEEHLRYANEPERSSPLFVIGGGSPSPIRVINASDVQTVVARVNAEVEVQGFISLEALQAAALKMNMSKEALASNCGLVCRGQFYSREHKSKNTPTVIEEVKAYVKEHGSIWYDNLNERAMTVSLNTRTLAALCSLKACNDKPYYVAQ